MKADFDTLEPEERRLILVCSDGLYEELTSSLHLALIRILRRFFGLTASRSPLKEHPLASVYYQTSFDAWDRVAKARVGSFFEFMKEEIPIFHLSPREASRRFQFDFGHPHDGTAYALHPCDSNRYLLPSAASERFAQEKMSAFQQIAGALGARRVELLSGDVSGKSAALRGAIPLPKVAAQLGLSADFDDGSKLERQVYAEFGKPTQAPYVPSSLERWVDEDPSLRALVNTRLQANVERARASLVFQDTFNLGAGLSAMVEQWKLEIGGQYRQFHESTWSFDIQFWPKAA